MALLNPPQVVPSVMRVIAEAIARADSNLRDVDAVARALAPGEFGRERAGVVKDSFTALRTLGLVFDDDGGLVLDDALRSVVERGRLLRPAWRQFLLRSIFDHPSAAGSVTAREDRTQGARDLVFGLAWLLAQDAAGPALAWSASHGSAAVQDLQAHQAGRNQNLWPFSNDTRYRTAERWAVALGLAVDESDGIRPLPTEALRAVVQGFGEGEWQVLDFCARIAAELPVMWKGTYRTELAERFGSDPDPDVAAGGVDSSLGLALLVLEEERLIRMRVLPDVERIELGAATSNPRPISHIEVTA
jgi:hypothetical protein